MWTLLLIVLTMAMNIAGSTPTVEIHPRQSASPLGCIWYCYLNGEIVNNGTVLDQFEDEPGCSDCPGSTCTGKLHGELHMGKDMFIGDYWASGTSLLTVHEDSYQFSSCNSTVKCRSRDVIGGPGLSISVISLEPCAAQVDFLAVMYASRSVVDEMTIQPLFVPLS